MQYIIKTFNKMIETLKRAWLPITGASTSLTLKVAAQTPAVMEVQTQNVFQIDHPFLYYFLIGVAGAAGGLLLKIVWACLKKIFPKYLNNLDK